MKKVYIFVAAILLLVGAGMLVTCSLFQFQTQEEIDAVIAGLEPAGTEEDTIPPGEVAGLSAVSGDGSVTLSWTDPADDDFSTCELWHGSGGSAATQFTSTLSPSGTTVSGLTNGTEYTFLVKTVDESGNVSEGVSTTGTPAAVEPDGVTWTLYSGNPALTVADLNSESLTYANLNGFYYASSWVIYDNGTYKMWTNGQNNSKVRIGYATSSDGYSWTPVGGSAGEGAVITNGGSANYHALGISVIKDGSTYKAWYACDDNGFSRYYYATSSDGISWSGRTLALGFDDGGALAFDDVQPGLTASCTVIKESNGTYKMWYVGRDSVASPYYFKIGLATSNDGISWTRVSGSGTGGCVFDSGTAGKFDDKNVVHPTVIKVGDTYKMWYYGAANSGANGIGYATSTDGINWTRHYQSGTSDGQLAEFDNQASYSSAPSVINTGSDYKMYYNWFNSVTGKKEIHVATCD